MAYSLVFTEAPGVGVIIEKKDSPEDLLGQTVVYPFNSLVLKVDTTYNSGSSLYEITGQVEVCRITDGEAIATFNVASGSVADSPHSGDMDVLMLSVMMALNGGSSTSTAIKNAVDDVVEIVGEINTAIGVGSGAVADSTNGLLLSIDNKINTLLEALDGGTRQFRVNVIA